MGQIYKITNHINDKLYIGQTINTIEDRYHGSTIKSVYVQTHNNHLKASMNKYGLDNFSIEVIYESDNIEDLNVMERHYIEIYDTTDPNFGYNKKEGGINGKNIALSIPVINKNTKEVFQSIRDACRKYTNIHHGQISAACKGKAIVAGGYQWAYFEGWDKEYSLQELLTNRPVINKITKEIFINGIEASKAYNTSPTSIYGCCKGEYHSINGQQWAYYTGENSNYDPTEFIHSQWKKVICVDTKEVFKSIVMAAEKYNINKNSISHCCNGIKITAGGYQWEYFEGWDKEYKLKPIPSSKKPVICLETQKVYDSLKEASEDTGANINSIVGCCKGRRRSAGGYSWRYFIVGEKYIFEKTFSKEKKVMCIDTGVIYDSVVSASKATGIHKVAIANCCLGRSKTSGKMKWKYVE